MEHLLDFFSNIDASAFTFDLDYISEKVIPVLNRGLWVSLSLIVPSVILGFIFGVAIGAGRVFAPPRIRRLLDLHVTLVRGVPLLVQMFIIYYGLPSIGIRFEPYVAGVLSFTICTSAYQAEYIRGALMSISQGQIKAAHALGFSTLKSVLWVIIPQALRRALPGCGNEVIYLIKYSSLASAIVMMDLTGEAVGLASQEYKYTEVYVMLGAYYLAITSAATLALYLIERKTAIPGFGRLAAGAAK
ncbi:MAG: amino acid ABC transporter permease [Desulfovibrionaceae bacterium]|nr:amino acid ABC transporter permease [Desulfovibrionaceae bacterium]